MREEENKFNVTSSSQIYSSFSSMYRQETNLHFKLKEQTLFIGKITNFDEKNRCFTVRFSREYIKQLESIAGGSIYATSKLDSINVSFHLMVDFGNIDFDLCKLTFLLPESIRIMQRREYYRVHVKSNKELYCELSRNNENSTQNKYRVRNISIGGIEIFDKSHLFLVEIGHVYKNSRIKLPGYSEIMCDLTVMSAAYKNDRNEGDGTQLGLEFSNMNPKSIADLQRYITKLEFELRPAV